MSARALDVAVCAGCGAVFKNWSHRATHAKFRKDCTPELRFWARVNKNAPSGCWIWTGCVDKWGYGDTSFNGKHVQAHRLAWRLLNGEPGALDVLHRCNTPPCCNPGHLYLGTDQDNSDDRRRSGTVIRGEMMYCATLTEAQVRDIIARATGKWGEGAKFAREFGVKVGTIHGVLRGDTWTHIPRPRTLKRHNTGRRKWLHTSRP